MRKLSLFVVGLTFAYMLNACTASRQVGGMPEVKSSSPVETAKTGRVTSTNTTIQENSQNEPQLLNIQSKFLAIDSTAIRVYYFVDAYLADKRLSVDTFKQQYTLNYVMYSDYGTRDRLGYGNVPLAEGNVFAAGERIGIWVDVKRPAQKESAILLTEITRSGTLKKMLNDLPVRFGNDQRTSDRLGVFVGTETMPHDRNFIHVGESFSVKSLNGTSSDLWVEYYKYSFPAAISPMNTKGAASVYDGLKPERVFEVKSNTDLAFEEEGLYYFRTDSTKNEGIGLLITDDRFPKLTMPSKLLDPLRYMSTNQEISSIAASEDFKKSLDRYWLNLMGGNQELAKNTIKNFYTRVEEANRLFTTYKEGWKTDKGMLFIILGPPDRVQKSRDKEVWVYDRQANAANVNFTFNRKTNQFVDNHYELVRYVEYQPVWFPSVEAWRNGSIR